MINDLEEVGLNRQAVIKVVGVGGGGGNAISHMISKRIEGISFCAANTDDQALRKISAQSQQVLSQNHNTLFQAITIGKESTGGLGAGAKPEVGRQAMEESIADIESYLQGTDMLFITAGMGGGTGTGAAPVLAALAKRMGILTVAVITKPFPFEGGRRIRSAEEGIKELKNHVDSLIVVPNAKLMESLGKNVSLIDCFNEANNVLHNSVQGISDLITSPGIINVDFADVRTTMLDMGMSMMGTGVASGDERAKKATDMAVHSPLLENIDIHGARSILVNVTAGSNLTIGEFYEVGSIIAEFADPDANIVVGTSFDESMNDSGDLRVTLVATGVVTESDRANMMGHQQFQGQYAPQQQRPQSAPQPQPVQHQQQQPMHHQQQQYQAQQQNGFQQDQRNEAYRPQPQNHQPMNTQNSYNGHQGYEQEAYHNGHNLERHGIPESHADDGVEGIRATPDNDMARDIDIPKKGGMMIPSFLRRKK